MICSSILTKTPVIKIHHHSSCFVQYMCYFCVVKSRPDDLASGGVTKSRTRYRPERKVRTVRAQPRFWRPKQSHTTSESELPIRKDSHIYPFLLSSALRLAAYRRMFREILITDAFIRISPAFLPTLSGNKINLISAWLNFGFGPRVCGLCVKDNPCLLRKLISAGCLARAFGRGREREDVALRGLWAFFFLFTYL